MKVISAQQQLKSTTRIIQNYSFNSSSLLGAGNFSKVYAGRNETTTDPVAIKVVQLQSLCAPKLQELHRNQLQVLKNVQHPNVLKCYDIFVDDRECYIITQLCNGGDLDMYVKREGFLTEEKAAPFIKDVFQGFLYLSDMRIIHRDLKVANVFINNGRAKIADFGFAVYAKQKFRDMNIGSPFYMPPEAFIDCIYGFKTDVWAFGILIYELLHGDTPYSFCKVQADLKYHLSMPFDRSKVRQNIAGDLKEVIFRCLQLDQSRRITFQELKNTRFFRRLYSYSSHIYLHVKEIKHPIYESIQHEHSKDRIQYINSNNFDNRAKDALSIAKSKQNPLAPAPIIFNTTVRHKVTFLQPPRDAIRLGRPISTGKVFVKGFDPQPQRQRLKSIDSKKPTDKFIIVNSIINFKIAVNIVHYCRCIFRALQLMILLKQTQNEIKYLSGWLILVLEELNRKLNLNEILFQGKNSQAKAKKLRQVRNQYERKYVNQLKNYISSFINKPSLQDIKLYLFLQYRKFDIAIQQDSYRTDNLLQLGHLIVLLYDTTRLLKKCQQETNFTRFSSFKDVENMLGLVKDKFNMESYNNFKKKMIINN